MVDWIDLNVQNFSTEKWLAINIKIQWTYSFCINLKNQSMVLINRVTFYGHFLNIFISENLGLISPILWQEAALSF